MAQLPNVLCIYCNISFESSGQLRLHCQTEAHEMMIMSDEGRDWQWRPPPRGLKIYELCPNYMDTKSCKFGHQCIQAHGDDELSEWQDRFKYREMKLRRAREKQLFGKSYTEELLEKWSQRPQNMMQEKLIDVDCMTSHPLSIVVPSKNSHHTWVFTINSARPLQAVALLQDTYRPYFSITNIQIDGQEMELRNQQEWVSEWILPQLTMEYEIHVNFTTTIFGTFRQSIVFDFGTEPVLVKHLCADFVRDTELEKFEDIRKDLVASLADRWTGWNSIIVPFTSSLSHGKETWDNKMKLLYPVPDGDDLRLAHSTISNDKFSKNDYRERMHELLYIEEMARYNLIANYNLTTKLQITPSYILSPDSTAASTAKYSCDGELYATVHLSRSLSEDTSEGRLILMHCNAVYFTRDVPKNGHPPKIYEAMIEDKTKNIIYLRLSKTTVDELNLNQDVDIKVQIQFQLNRVPYCEWHYVVDKIANFSLIFPETYLNPLIPWSPSRQWSKSFDPRLNVKQKEAVVAITTPLNVQLPPVLVIGPFGTGKTFTLAQAVKELIQVSTNRVLLCTHSNSAADLYIKDYFHKWVEDGQDNARPLRIYYEQRWVSTVHTTVQKYCLIEENTAGRNFRLPQITDLEKHQIVVVTLSTSLQLTHLDLPTNFFTHILIDEAAQAFECETITPLALATEQTRIVLAGDHMQIGPDIFSSFAKERNLHISLLERLYDLYPVDFACKILLCENYRAHQQVVQFISENFYQQKLMASGKQSSHPHFYPLSFFTARGEDVQDKNSTAYYNVSEVYEVVERVVEFKNNWPSNWGAFDDQSIGIVTPYADQVFRIRSELRKLRINVCVERVLNVQGKQFRVIILSTVRTRKTCDSDKDYGFLSDSKLLNTAITRAQSLVAVVGDPVALCSVGRCSKVWEKFMQICNENDSLNGITLAQLKLQLDGIELKKIYTLNPLAPEFVPRSQPATHSNYMTSQFIAARVDRAPLMYQPMIYSPPMVIGSMDFYMPPTMRLMAPQIVTPIPPQPQKQKLVEFMNNVHFPQPTFLQECMAVLPHNMSLADMMGQSRYIQEKWFHYLMETSGYEAAMKFKCLLDTINVKGSNFVAEPKESTIHHSLNTSPSSSTTSQSSSLVDHALVDSILDLNVEDFENQMKREFPNVTTSSDDDGQEKRPKFCKFFHS